MLKSSESIRESKNCNSSFCKMYSKPHWKLWGYIDLLFTSSIFAPLIFSVVKRLTKKKRTLIKIPLEVGDALIGILLGDGHIQKRSLKGNSRLMFIQTVPKHQQYFNHVFNMFREYCISGFKPSVRKSFTGDVVYQSMTFATMQLNCFNYYREIFYVNGLKIVPTNIYELLTPRGLAHWIMDDGSRHGQGLHLSVYAFTTTDIDRLVFTLQDKFNLKCSIHLNRLGQPRIYIFKESMDKLRNLTKQFFVQDMLYKLGDAL